jgi:putative membrane protein
MAHAMAVRGGARERMAAQAGASAFFGTALLFWRSVLAAPVGPALAGGFATLIHGGLLGALITLAPYPLYRWYHGRTEPWGWTPLEDQQLAGLLMWVLMGVIYFAACLLLASRLLATEERYAQGADQL